VQVPCPRVLFAARQPSGCLPWFAIWQTQACGGVSVGGVECLGFEERASEAVELIAMIGEQLDDIRVSVRDQPLHFLVDDPLSSL
jgi:hypothetical protein